MEKQEQLSNCDHCGKLMIQSNKYYYGDDLVCLICEANAQLNWKIINDPNFMDNDNLINYTEKLIISRELIV